MFRKSLFVFLLLISACAIAFAQQTTEKKEDKPDKNFAFIFGDDGGYLGVQAQEINKENFSKYGLSAVRGVGVEKVLENSPAAQAGLQNGDVILRFNGEEIASVKKLSRLIDEVAPDHQATLTISRSGSEREVTVTLGKRPFGFFENGKFDIKIMPPNVQMPKDLPQMKDFPQLKEFPQIQELPMMKDGEKPGEFVWQFGAGRQIGVGVTPLTKQLGEYFGVAEGKGLLVNSVRENSPAERAGLKAGDVIVEADGKEVKGNGDLICAIVEKKEGDVSLTIIRDKNRQIVRVTPEVSKDAPFQFDNLIKPSEMPQMNFQMPKPQIAPMVPGKPMLPLRIL